MLANVDTVSAGAANVATKQGMLVRCSVMHAEAREAEGSTMRCDKFVACPNLHERGAPEH